MESKNKFEYKKNSYFEEGKNYTFKTRNDTFKSKVVKARNNLYYTVSDGVNINEKGIYKATSILTLKKEVRSIIGK